MMIEVNGRAKEVPEGTTAGGLLDMLGHRAEVVAMEIDGKICPRQIRDTTVLEAGQSVEIVSFVGGG